MSRRLQVIVGDEEAEQFRAQAAKEKKALSAWLREAGLRAVAEKEAKSSLRSFQGLREFFVRQKQNELQGEPDWDELKTAILARARSK
jgi:hypothetical protein